MFRHDKHGLLFFVCRRQVSTFPRTASIQQEDAKASLCAQPAGSPATSSGHLVEAPSFPPATSRHGRVRVEGSALHPVFSGAASASLCPQRAKTRACRTGVRTKGPKAFRDIRACYAATELRQFLSHPPSKNRTRGQARAIRAGPSACRERGGRCIASAHPGEDTLRARAPPCPLSRRTLGRTGHAARGLVGRRARLRVIDGARAATAPLPLPLPPSPQPCRRPRAARLLLPPLPPPSLGHGPVRGPAGARALAAPGCR